MFGLMDEDQQSIKNSLNIVQFFLRAPNLINFFFDEINSYLNDPEKQLNMYPTLYPICLILSRLLPYDMKNDDMKFLENQQNEDMETDREEVEVSSFKDSRIITTQEIRQFYNLLLRCANNNNYLGRLLVARAIIPFIPIDDIFFHIKQIYPKSINTIKRNHNQAHGRILIVKFAMRN